MRERIDPQDALRRAVEAIEAGPWDPRSADGARQNALDSIAWSLIGLLGQMQQDDARSVARPSRRHDGRPVEVRR